MIPQRLLVFVPADIRDRWANRIVECFEEQNPQLYSAMGQWNVIPEEEKESVMREILTAAEKVHREIRSADEER